MSEISYTWADHRVFAATGDAKAILFGADAASLFALDGETADVIARCGLAYLLRRLGKLEGIRWIRVMYAYPATVTDPILDAIASEEKVVKYIDIPLQHKSERVLSRMKRPTGRGNLLGLVERMRKRVPGVTLRTSFIVGFPGETASDFEELLGFARDAEFDNVGVFTYSDEEGTSAFELPERVPARVKESRKRKLMAVQQRIVARRNRRRVGERLEVLVEGPHPESDLLLQGRTAGQAPEIDGAVILNDGWAAAGSFVTATVTEAQGYDLIARIEGPA